MYDLTDLTVSVIHQIDIKSRTHNFLILSDPSGLFNFCFQLIDIIKAYFPSDNCKGSAYQVYL